MTNTMRGETLYIDGYPVNYPGGYKPLMDWATQHGLDPMRIISGTINVYTSDQEIVCNIIDDPPSITRKDEIRTHETTFPLRTPPPQPPTT